MSRSRLPRYLRRPLLIFALGAAVIGPPAALGDAFQQVEATYAKTGAIPPCMFSSSALAAALKNAPTYDVEYFGDFTATIQATLSAQASGRCARHSSAVTGPVPGLAPPTHLPGLPRSVTAGGGGAVPLPLLLALVAGLVAVVGAAVVLIPRRFGWEPAWSLRAGHAWADAEYRLSGTWAEFRDWLSARP